MIIYCVTNLVNGKQYVGQTIHTVQERWAKHLCKNSGCVALKGAISKYGKDNFDVRIIDEAKTQSELDDKERFWIEYLNTLSPNGYNLTSGGNHVTFTEEVKNKIRVANTGKRHSEETKAKISEKKIKNYCKEKPPLYGKHHSEETKRKLSEKNKGQVFSEERNKKVSASTFGGKNHRARKVKCIETSEIFNCIADVERKYNIDRHKIISSCKGKRKSGVKINNIETHWIYID